MNNKKIQLHTLAESVSLSQAEKSIMKAEMLKAMRTPSASSSYQMMFFYMKNHITALALIVLVFSSTTTSVLANKSIPGEALYAVKTKVNEPIESLFATSEYEKAEWSVVLATRRLEEAKILEEKEGVSVEVKTRHKKILDEQIRLADARTTPFKEDDEEEEYGETIAMNARAVSSFSKKSEDAPLSDTVAFTAMSANDPAQEMMSVSLSVESAPAEEESPEDRIRNAILDVEQKIVDARKNKLPKEKILRLYARKIKLESSLMELSSVKLPIDTLMEEEQPTSSSGDVQVEGSFLPTSSSSLEIVPTIPRDEGEVEGEYDMHGESQSFKEDRLQETGIIETKPIRSLLRDIR